MFPTELDLSTFKCATCAKCPLMKLFFLLSLSLYLSRSQVSSLLKNHLDSRCCLSIPFSMWSSLWCFCYLFTLFYFVLFRCSVFFLCNQSYFAFGISKQILVLVAHPCHKQFISAPAISAAIVCMYLKWSGANNQQIDSDIKISL